MSYSSIFVCCLEIWLSSEQFFSIDDWTTFISSQHSSWGWDRRFSRAVFLNIAVSSITGIPRSLPPIDLRPNSAGSTFKNCLFSPKTKISLAGGSLFLFDISSHFDCKTLQNHSQLLETITQINFGYCVQYNWNQSCMKHISAQKFVEVYFYNKELIFSLSCQRESCSGQKVKL